MRPQLLLPTFLAVVVLLLAACTSPARQEPPPPRGPIQDTAPQSTLYVSPTGDDAAPGTTPDRPLKTIGRAAQLAGPGTTVHVAGGRYVGAVMTAATGKSHSRITYVADPPGSAEIIGTGTGAAWRNRGDHVDIIGFRINGGSVDGLINEASFVRIIDNVVTDFPESNCITTARTGYTLNNIDILGNTVARCGSSPLDHGIYVGHPTGVVANNIAFGNTGFGIHCWHNCNNLIISNNLVFDNATGGILIGQGDSPNNGEIDADGFVVSNNIAVNNGGYGIQEYGATGDNNHYLNNNIFGNERDGLQLQTGEEAHTLTTWPGFVDFKVDGSGDYRLLPGSPMIDAGTPTGAVETDITGTERPRGAGVDIGVYEF